MEAQKTDAFQWDPIKYDEGDDSTLAEYLEELDEAYSMNWDTDSDVNISNEHTAINEPWLNDSQNCPCCKNQSEWLDVGGIKRKAEDQPQLISQSPKRSKKEKKFLVIEQISETMTVREAQYLVAQMILSRSEKRPLRIKLKDEYIKACNQSFQNQVEENGYVYENL